MVHAVIFDLDDTLCDYQKARKNAITHVNAILMNNGIDTDKFWDNYYRKEPVLWREFMDDIITKEEYRIRRYKDALPKDSYKLAEKLNCVYMDEANHNIELFEDVIPLLEILNMEGIKPAILTNGPSDGQRDKIRALNLEKYIQNIYISEEIGLSKPNRDVFEYVVKELHEKPCTVVMVGDSLEEDIKGAEMAGINAFLIDRKNKYINYTGARIVTLLELQNILK
jgi:putative hydrolase of the HAD superfamily